MQHFRLWKADGQTKAGDSISKAIHDLLQVVLAACQESTIISIQELCDKILRDFGVSLKPAEIEQLTIGAEPDEHATVKIVRGDLKGGGEENAEEQRC